LENVELRLCIFEARRSGQIRFDDVYSISAGQQDIDLGRFEEGPHIIRVYADGELVENISFMVR
jgi:hypothetical protein